MFSVKKRQHVNSPTLRTHRLIVKLLFLFLLTTLALSACHEKEEHLSLSLDSISQISDESMLVSEESLREAIHHMVMADSDRDVAAIQTRRHYLNGGAIRWMTRDGVSAKADTLVAYLERVEQVGISPKLFYASQIKDDLERVRSLNFGEGKNSVSRVYGRLEYLLTKAFLRYTEGQRFGFVNPREVLNRLDVRDSDSVRTTYRQLYDVPTKRPGKDYVALAFGVMGSNDASVAKFLRESEPKNPLYATLVRHLSDPLKGRPATPSDQHRTKQMGPRRLSAEPQQVRAHKHPFRASSCRGRRGTHDHAHRHWKPQDQDAAPQQSRKANGL